MTIRVKARCPGCQAVLTIERPHEPRSAPCPGCGHLIRVPEDIEAADGGSPAPRQFKETQMRQDWESPNVSEQVEGSARLKPKSGWSGFKLLACLALLPMGFVAAQLSMKTFGGVGAQAAQLAEDDNRFEEDIRDNIAELEVKKSQLLGQQEELLRQIDDVESQIRKQLNVSEQEIHELSTLYAGDQS